MHDELLSALTAEIDRQNTAYGEAKSALMSLGEVELQVPAAFIDDLEEVVFAARFGNAVPMNALRG